MKKIFAALALAVAIPVAFATGDHGGGLNAGPKLDRMVEHLQLTEEQKSRMQTLFDEQHAQRQAMREQMRAKIAEVLTPEQLGKMEQFHEQRKARCKGKGEHTSGHDDDVKAN